MVSETLTHMDCRNYAPVDAAKGICHRTKQLVVADDHRCDAFTKLPKCKHCEHYLAGKELYTGICRAVKDTPMTYPDLAAVTCDWFQWNDRKPQK